MMRFMRTTIDINDALLDSLKELAKSEGRLVTKIVNETLERGLAAELNSKKKVRIKNPCSRHPPRLPRHEHEPDV